MAMVVPTTAEHKTAKISLTRASRTPGSVGCRRQMNDADRLDRRIAEGHWATNVAILRKRDEGLPLTHFLLPDRAAAARRSRPGSMPCGPRSDSPGPVGSVVGLSPRPRTS